MSPPAADRVRLDQVLVERGLARSRSHAQALVREGAVLVDGEVARRPGEPVTARADVVARSDPYVSRAAHKLLGALDDLALPVGGRALDAGASTGGFTQVLLERGCRQVHAVDVGTDQLAPGLRADPRVVVHEQTNLRDLRLEQLDGQPVDLTVADVSFISLTLLVAPLAAATDPAGAMLLMVKPQFEVGRERLGRGGVVRSVVQHAEAVGSVAGAATVHGWHAVGLSRSRLPGPAGNQEFFLLLRTRAPERPLDVVAAVVAASTPG